MTELLTAFMLIFIAEMGDKTQILAMTFATKYKIKYVLTGIFIGSLLNHSLAVLLGANLYRIIPIDLLKIIAGISFVLFGLWALHLDTEDINKKSKSYGPIIAVSLAFFIGELGDKTQLTAIVLATDAVNPLLVLSGTVLGMTVTGLLGILLGIKIGHKIDEFYIKLGSSVVFITFGVLKLFDSIDQTFLTQTNITVGFMVLISLYAILLYQSFMVRKEQTTTYQRIAMRLYNYYSDIYKHLEDICLGETIVGYVEETIVW